MKQVTYSTNGELNHLQVEGQVYVGEQVCLLEHDDNLIADTAWFDDGYVVEKLFDNDVWIDFCSKINAKLNDAIFKVIGKKIDNLALYHQYVTDQQHMEILSHTYGGITFTEIGFDKQMLIDRISQIVGIDLDTVNPNYTESDGNVFFLRVVRPNSADNNPLHRDVWLDRLRDAVNIYIPLCGSNEKSSLPLIAGSHQWKESEIERTRSGAKINGRSYTVPAVTGSQFGLNAIRPTVDDNQVMVFSPYLVHGGGTNRNENVTRVSLELRFWRS